MTHQPKRKSPSASERATFFAWRMTSKSVLSLAMTQRCDGGDSPPLSPTEYYGGNWPEVFIYISQTIHLNVCLFVYLYTHIFLPGSGFVHKACAQEDDLRLSGPPSGQVARAQTHDRKIPVDLSAGLLTTVPPSPCLTPHL
ncbi:hypothetical protein PoB_003532000 [Plakobranchus ocellatus]|uniref:Uncharacterized protein n=1 Tax=Plakobranchus ocellatus TaxID=259542 RepID=A0AAV4AKW8_9GAST|nr:hypothetical protein PoB_003532000 [Plakobranchus ocellatus]